MVEAQGGLRYTDMLDLARAAEAAGFEAFLRSDHWLSFDARPVFDGAGVVVAGISQRCPPHR